MGSVVVYFSDLFPKRFPACFDALKGLLNEHGILCRLISGTRDIWIRDYAPIQIAPDRFVQFQYAPDYLRGEFASTITPPEVFAQLRWLENVTNSDIILDGGNVVRAPGTAILTDKIYRENPGWERPHLREALRGLLQVERLIIVPKEPYDRIGHADAMVRFVSENEVVISDYSKIEPVFEKRFHQELTKGGLRIASSLPYVPTGERLNGIDSAVGNYVNFLDAGGLIVVPRYGLPVEQTVTERMRRLYPTKTIASVDCKDLAAEGGVLNCVTWTNEVEIPPDE